MAKISHVHGGNLYRIARENAINPKEILDFSANINPLGPSEIVINAVTEGINWINHYPDSTSYDALKAISSHVGLPLKNLGLGNGAIELMYLLMQILKPKRVLIPAPTFSEYESAVSIAGGTVKYYELDKGNGFAIDANEFIANMKSCDLGIICNPNNPTGVLQDKKCLEYVVKALASQNKFLLVDEAFIDFTKDGRKNSVAELVKKYPNLIISYSLTKILSIPGLRLGSLLANEEIIDRINLVRDPWNVNTLAQEACVAGLRDKKFFDETRNWLKDEQGFMIAELNKVSYIKAFEPNANFILLKVLAPATGVGLINFLSKHNVMVRNCSSFHGLDDNWIRIAIKSREDNTKLIRLVADYMTKGDF